jgi:hypothetical protein
VKSCFYRIKIKPYINFIFNMKNQTVILKTSFFFALALSILFIGCAKETSEPAPVAAVVNSAPTISSVQVNPSTVAAGGSASITVVASDANNDNLTYSYTVSGGAVNGSGASASWTAPSTAGAYSVTVTVTDGNGGEASSNGSLTVSAPITQITGSATLPGGSSLDLSNAQVKLYLNEAAWNSDIAAVTSTVMGTGASVTFNLQPAPETYYLEIWKDLNGDGVFSSGDLVGHFGMGAEVVFNNFTPISLGAGQTVNVGVINMVVI